MKKIDKLIKEAKSGCEWRGHMMQKFVHYNSERAYSECACCGAWVQVETKPAPNSIDIGGPAVAIGCNG